MSDKLLKRYGLDFPPASDEPRRLAEDVRVPRISKRKSAIVVDPKRLADQVAEIMIEYFAKEIASRDARIAALEASQKSFRYRGVHKAGMTYAAGDWTTYGGNLWCAGADTSEPPPGGAWTLAVRRERS